MCPRTLARNDCPVVVEAGATNTKLGCADWQENRRNLSRTETAGFIHRPTLARFPDLPSSLHRGLGSGHS